MKFALLSILNNFVLYLNLKLILIIFIVAPCIVIHVEFTHQQMQSLFKKHFKIYIKIHINISPTYFGLRSSSGSLH